MKMIGVPDNVHKELKILAAINSKKIYELIVEAIVLLKEKYSE